MINFMSAINTILFGDQTASIRTLNYQEQMKDSIQRALQFYFAYLKQLIELVEANQDHQSISLDALESIFNEN